MMTYDPTSQRMLLYVPQYSSGVGCVAGSATNCGVREAETWSWDGTEWSRSNATTPVIGTELALDPRLHRPVLLAADGTATQPCIRSTWVWNGHSWINQKGAQTPSESNSEGLVADPSSGSLLLVETVTPFPVPYSDCNSSGPAWRWNGTSWTNNPQVAGGPTQFFDIGSEDSAHEVVVLTATGETLTWDGSAWTERHSAQSPGARRGAAITYDASQHRLVLFGGAASSPIGDTWLWDGSNWSH